jgi:hypothetical protein
VNELLKLSSNVNECKPLIDGIMVPLPPLIGQNGGYVAGTEPGSGEVGAYTRPLLS